MIQAVLEILAFMLITYFGSAVVYVGICSSDWVLTLLGIGLVVCAFWRFFAKLKEDSL